MKARPDEDHELLCKLDADELRVKGDHLAEAVEALRKAEEEKGIAMKAFAARIDAAKLAALTLKAEILSRQERRMVPCRWYVETNDTGTEQWVLRRTDTAAVIQYAPVTSADRQLELIAGGLS